MTAGSGPGAAGRARRVFLRAESLVVRAAVRAVDRWAGPWLRRRRLSPYVLFVVEGQLAGADLDSAVAAARRLGASGVPDARGDRQLGRLQLMARRPHEVLAERPSR